MIIPDTDEFQIPFQNKVTHYFSSDLGEISLRRKLEDGSFADVAGSPILDGEEVEVTTSSSDGQLHVTASAPGTILIYGQKGS